MWAPLAKLLDHAVITLISAMRPRYLRDTAELAKRDFPGIIERWRGARVEFTPRDTRGRREYFDVRVETDHALIETECFRERADPRSRRLLVYHHGLGEHPPTRTFDRLIAGGPDPLDADRVLLVAPGHAPGHRDLIERLARLDGFESLLLCGVIVAKAVADRWRDDYDRRVLCGTSLGGLVAMTETLFEPRYDSNVSLIATPFLSSQFLASSLTRLIDPAFRERTSIEQLATAIDLDDLIGRDGRRIVMLNGRHDTMVRIAPLRAWWRTRPGIEAHELDISHLSMLVCAGEVRRPLRQVLRRELEGALDGATRAAYTSTSTNPT